MEVVVGASGDSRKRRRGLAARASSRARAPSATSTSTPTTAATTAEQKYAPDLKGPGRFFIQNSKEVQADILCEAAADLAFYEVHDQLAVALMTAALRCPAWHCSCAGLPMTAMQVEVRRAVLAGERTGEGPSS